MASEISTTGPTILTETDKICDKTETQSSIWGDFDSAVELRIERPNPMPSSIIEIDKYLQEPLLDRRSSDIDPFTWRSQRQIYCPHIYKIMKKTLCIVRSSVPCEGIFSKTGNILTERRASLKSNKLSKIVFLNFNM